MVPQDVEKCGPVVLDGDLVAVDPESDQRLS
jgi:hypothetical protein